MPGPVPKPPELRQRRNRESTAATLVAPENPTIPKLKAPDRGRRWHPDTKAWWKDVWSSPMAGEYIATDVWGLTQVAVLRDNANKATDPKLHKELMAELRHQEMRFGLSSIDRRRLQWEIQRVEHKPKQAPAAPRPDRAVDPRSVLKAVQ